MLAPLGFWAPDFDHMSLTGLIGLPAPGYALTDVKTPPPLPKPVLSYQPVPAASDTSYLDTWHLEFKRLPCQVSTIELLNLIPGHFTELHSVPCSISAGPVARCVGLWWIAIEWPNCASGAVGSSLSSTQFPARSLPIPSCIVLDGGGLCAGSALELCRK